MCNKELLSTQDRLNWSLGDRQEEDKRCQSRDEAPSRHFPSDAG